MADQKSWGAALYEIDLGDDQTQRIVASGRDRWALEELLEAGRKGCSPFDTPGPRWSGYIHNLRKLGVPIETVTEAHDGPFAGTHARYVLKARVKRVQGREEAA